MDEHIRGIRALSVERVLNGLSKNQMKGYYLSSPEALLPLIQTLVAEEAVVSVGGSMTLFELGLITWLKENRPNYLDRYREGISGDEITTLYRQCFSADAYLTSTQAITENGELFNVDGRGNRVAAMIYGPSKVIVVCGTNKIVVDEKAAIERNKRLAAPANAKRLKRQTPCASLGYCTECNSPDRICADYVLMRRQVVKDRIHVILVEGDYGY